MDPTRIKTLLAQVKSGEVDVGQALVQLRELPFADLGYAQVDHHRALRLGMPEVIFGEGKTPAQIVGIARALIDSGQRVLVTRLDADKARIVGEGLPQLEYNAVARTATYAEGQIEQRSSVPVAVVCAGTSDVPVAEEAMETLRMLGIAAQRVFDVGVAGIHRLLGKMEILSKAPALIVIAGMEGALPSVVAGLVRQPVIAVPTSIGYGAALGGFTALFGMLTGCASGVTVVNIDNGFGAAMAVGRIVVRPEESQVVA